MEKYGAKRARKIRGRHTMTAVAIGNTFALASRWVDILRGMKPKAIAERIGASHRTVENWQDGENGPAWRHTVAMLNDDEMAPMLLRAAGRIDLAKQLEILSLEKRVEALKQAEQRHKEEAHAIRESLGASRAGGLVGGRSVQRDGDEAQAGSGVVPRPSKE
jgi:hypothetical protein